MSSELAQLRPPSGSRHAIKRVARGPGSGWGKTAARGQKGQTSRSGKSKGIRVGFEGGQMPLQRRLPKRGFINPFRKEKAVVNLRDLARFPVGSVVGPTELVEMGLVQSRADGVKILAMGEIGHALTVRAHACSVAAKKKIEAAGGTVEIIGAGGRDAAGETEQLEQ